MTDEKLLFSKSFQTFHLVISLLQKIGYVKKKEWWLKRRKDGYKVHSPDRLGGLVSGNKNHFLKRIHVSCNKLCLLDTIKRKKKHVPSPKIRKIFGLAKQK